MEQAKGLPLVMATPKKRTRRPIAPADSEQLSPDALVEQGRNAFAHGEYTAAIQAWQRARRALTDDAARLARLVAALAEAHFRRGMTTDPANPDDLAEAVHLAPDDPRFQYHLALAHQRRGDQAQASTLYRGLLARTPPYTRAAFPLAVALVAAGRQPRKDPVWRLLSPDERERIVRAYVLVRERPTGMQPQAARQGADALWSGLAAFARHDATAAGLLQEALDDPTLSRQGASVAHYYAGVLAWQQGQYEQAMADWQAAHRAGLRAPWLLHNLASAFKREALTALERTQSAPGDGRPGEVETNSMLHVLQLAERGLRHAPHDAGLNEIRNHARAHLGYQAALAGDWAGALDTMWVACQPGGGGECRALLSNAALASEHMKRFAQAAGLWQQLVRKRPRKAGAPGALTKEQAARMWRRVADSYVRAGDYEEAVRAYRNAVRNAPADLTLHLGLVQALVNDERYTAALSATDQILRVQPRHAEALAWRARALDQSGYIYAALQAWQRVLKVEPQHPMAYPNMARLNREEGDYHREHGNLRRAIVAYRDGIRYAPADARLRASLGLGYGLQGNLNQARKELEALLGARSHEAEAHYWATWAWLALGEWEEARAQLARAEALEPPPPPDFYIELAAWCTRGGRKRWAARLLDMAEARTPDDAAALLKLSEAFKDNNQEEHAARCLERVLRLDPDHAEAHLRLGLHYLARGSDLRVADEHFRRAEQLARRSGDSGMLMQVRVVKNLSRLGGEG
jgi:tetratricopeptide (TPR) repeat protein